MQDPLQKITRAKKDGTMAQVLEHLPSKCKALNLHHKEKKNWGLKRVEEGVNLSKAHYTHI
jgi:hypothetical protein